MKVLLVDDEEEMAAALAERLSFREIDAEWVTCGKDAIALLGENHFDVLVLDVKMPGMSGIELYWRIQKIAKSLRKRIIFLTGDVMGEETKKFLEKNKARCITKPFNVIQLKRDINQVLAAAG